MTGRIMLKKWMSNRKLNNRQIARMIGSSEATVSRYVSGSRTPCLLYAIRIKQITDGLVPTETWKCK